MSLEKRRERVESAIIDFFFMKALQAQRVFIFAWVDVKTCTINYVSPQNGEESMNKMPQLFRPVKCKCFFPVIMIMLM